MFEKFSHGVRLRKGTECICSSLYGFQKLAAYPKQLSSERRGSNLAQSEGGDVHTIARSARVSHLLREMAMVPDKEADRVGYVASSEEWAAQHGRVGGNRKSVRGVVGVFGSPKDPILHDQTRDGYWRVLDQPRVEKAQERAEGGDRPVVIREVLGCRRSHRVVPKRAERIVCHRPRNGEALSHHLEPLNRE